MRFHFESSHPSAYKKLIEKFPIQNSVNKENVDEAPPLASKKSDTKANTVDSILTNSLEKRLSRMTFDEAKHAVFDPVTYKTLFLASLTAKDLPFAHSDSPVLAVLLAYARRCDSVDLPTVNRQSMRAALDIAYRESVDELKSTLAKHKGKIALTLDEWNFGNNFDFLAVILHYHDYDFKMRKYSIDFEVVNKDMFFTGEVLYRHLDIVRTEYNIKDRIISITKDRTPSKLSSN